MNLLNKNIYIFIGVQRTRWGTCHWVWYQIHGNICQSFHKCWRSIFYVSKRHQVQNGKTTGKYEIFFFSWNRTFYTMPFAIFKLNLSFLLSFFPHLLPTFSDFTAGKNGVHAMCVLKKNCSNLEIFLNYDYNYAVLIFLCKFDMFLKQFCKNWPTYI